MSPHRRRPASVAALAAALSFQGVSAVAGGLGLALDPSGAAVGIPLDWLRGSPFDDFLVPGLVLLVALGLFPLVAAFALWTRRPWSRTAAGGVGVALLVWLLVQIRWIGYHARPPLQLLYGLLGITIVTLALMASVGRYLEGDGLGEERAS